MPKGRIQSLQKDSSGLGPPIAVGVAKQANPVGAFGGGTGRLLRRALDNAPQAEAAFALGRPIGLCHQNIAIGKHMKPAGMVEAASKFIDAQS